MIKNLKQFISVLLCGMLLFFSCNHGSSDDDSNSDPVLKLESLFIHGTEVKNGKVEIVNEEKITADDIIAKFNYGKSKEKIIKVTVKGGEFSIDKTESKKLQLSVASLKGSYQAWKAEVEVSYKEVVVDNELLSFLEVYMGKDGGRNLYLSEDATSRILNGKNIVAELKGPKAKLTIASEKVTWSHLKVNDKAVLFAPKHLPKKDFFSYATTYVEIGEIGQTKEIKISVEAGTKKTEVRFKIKRLDGTIDIPDLGLLVDEKYLIEKDTLEKLQDASTPDEDTPIFMAGGEPSKIGVRCWHNEMDAVTVNSVEASITEKISTLPEGKKPSWLAEGYVKDIPDEGKGVMVVIEPKDKTSYHTITWRFRIKLEEKKPVEVLYTFNRKGVQQLGSDFITAAEGDGNPLLEFEGVQLNMELNYLNARLDEITINETSITDDKLNWDGAFGGVVFHSVKVGTVEKQIEITLIPQDKKKFINKVIRFRAKGNGVKENIPSKLTIGEYNLPDDFTSHLTDGSKPTFKVAENKAELKINVDEYVFKCLCNKVKVTVDSNEETLDINANKISFTVTHYYATKEVDLSGPKEIKIEFIPKDAEVAEATPLQFKLETGGQKPSLPQDKIYAFTINKKGEYKNPLPKNVADHLTDGTKPLYVIDSDKASIVIFWRATVNDLFEKAIFKMDGVQEDETAPETLGVFYGVRHVFNLTQQKPKEYEIEIELIPQDKTKYSSLIYSLKLQNSGLKEALPVYFGYNNKFVEETGLETTLTTEVAEVFVQFYTELVQSVTIDGKNCTIKKIEYKPNEFVYKAMSDVVLPTDSAKDVKIVVTPMNTDDYRITECTYKLKGTKIDQNNAEFEYLGNKPKVMSDIEWVDGKEHKYADDYGAKTCILTAYTVSPRAKVYYKVFNYKIEDGVQTDEEIELTPQTILTADYSGAKHTSNKITLFNDKPTMVKIWVVAEDGSTDETKGMKIITYNPVELRWDYETKNIGLDFAYPAYDEVKVDKSKVKNGKIHLAFKAWNETFGYKVKDAKFVKLDKDDYEQWYGIEVDVSALNSSSPITIEFPIYQDKGTLLCFTYKVKIEEK